MRTPFNRFTGPDWRQVSLRKAVYALEDAVITLSGPALAVSGIIAGVDLLTGGTMLKDVGWLSMAWAICLLLTLDFQVLALGARAHRIYLSDKSRWRKVGEIALAFLMAAGISSVSIQMQSIIAIMNSETRASIAIAAAVVIFVPFPGILFNRTLEENYDEIVARVRRTRRRLRG